jgi:Rps23 Pro-64 3,4-dihydroxylase Tpa1-like proline 4-hydroxylase
LAFRDPQSYGYYPSIVSESRRAYVVPEVGGLGFFNSRNMHEVEKVEVEPVPELGLLYRPRLTLSSFMGLIPASKTGGKPKLIFWS